MSHDHYDVPDFDFNEIAHADADELENILQNLGDDDIERLYEQHEFVQEGMPVNTRANEAIIAREVSNRRKRKEIEARYTKQNKAKNKDLSLGERFLNAAVAPFKFYKDGGLTAIKDTTIGTAIVAAPTIAAHFAFAADINYKAIAAAVVLSYPIFNKFERAGGWIGKWKGHYLNGVNEERYNEVTTVPRGEEKGVKWAFGALAAMALAAPFGPNVADTTWNIVSDIPGAIASTQSFIVDNTTQASNTWLDWKWQIEDQGKCLYYNEVNPGRTFLGLSLECKTGPGSEAITMNVDKEALQNAGYIVPAVEAQEAAADTPAVEETIVPVTPNQETPAANPERQDVVTPKATNDNGKVAPAPAVPAMM